LLGKGSRSPGGEKKKGYEKGKVQRKGGVTWARGKPLKRRRESKRKRKQREGCEYHPEGGGTRYAILGSRNKGITAKKVNGTMGEGGGKKKRGQGAVKTGG